MNSRFFNALAIAFLTITVACAAPGKTSAEPSGIPLEATALPLNPSDSLQAQVGRLRYRGGIVLTSGDILFGGLSSIDVAPDGRRMIAMSDNGRWVSATLQYTNGDLTGIADAVMKPIKRLPGYDRPGNWRDAESISSDGSGGYFVAFERQHRIWHYRGHPPESPMDAVPIELKGPDDIAKQPANGGIEGIARLCDRRLLAVSESAPGDPGTTKAWVFDGKWKAVGYATTGRFHPTDATTLPDCNVVVLERSFSVPEGVRSRVALVPAKTIRPGAVLRGEELAVIAQPLSVDNMEGISARRGENGEMLIYLVSDDNFSGFQRTLLMMFELLPPPPEGKASRG
ncbi:MAG: hypothetical protein GEU87_20930 [Alphaproteobacteria bacterium]|nr:hypothetical protein [Alphaproteobacteria bacterium]